MRTKLLSILLILLLVLTACNAFGTVDPGQGASEEAPKSQTTEEQEADTAADLAGYQQLFEGDSVLDVHITISKEDWESILESPRDKDYKSVTVEIGGITLEDVGFSTKGNSTLTAVAGSDSDRYSFRLKFDKFVDGQTLLGLDKMSMNNNMSDASYMREYLHYEALSLTGQPTPLTTYVNLYINGELYGLYTGVENVEKAFLERNFGEDYKDGVLYDTEENATLLYEESGEYSTLTYNRGTDDGKDSLSRFIEVLNGMPDGEKGEIESVLDVESALIYIAGNTVFGNYDSYNGRMAHNYKLYGNADGVYTVIPWDFNMSFDGFSMGGGDAVEIPIREPVSGTTMDRAPLISNLLAVGEYYERYLDYVRLFTDYLETVEGRANELADLIRPHVDADPTKFYTIEDFEASLIYDENEIRRNEGMPGQGPDDDTNWPQVGDMPDMPVPEEGEFPPMQPGSRGDREDSPASETPDFEGVPPDMGEGTGGNLPDRKGEGRPGSGFGGGLMNSSGSLVTFAVDRAENLRQQLMQAYESTS